MLGSQKCHLIHTSAWCLRENQAVIMFSSQFSIVVEVAVEDPPTPPYTIIISHALQGIFF